MKGAHFFFLFFIFKSREEAERKQANLLIDLIFSNSPRLTFQSAAMRREIIQRKQEENDDDVLAAVAAAEEKGVCLKIEHLQRLLFFQHLQNGAAFQSAAPLAAKQNTPFLAAAHHRATKSKAGPFAALPPPPFLPYEGK